MSEFSNNHPKLANAFAVAAGTAAVAGIGLALFGVQALAGNPPSPAEAVGLALLGSGSAGAIAAGATRAIGRLFL